MKGDITRILLPKPTHLAVGFRTLHLNVPAAYIGALKDEKRIIDRKYESLLKK